MTFGTFTVRTSRLATLAFGIGLVGCAGESPTQASSASAPPPAAPTPETPRSQGTGPTLLVSADTICLRSVVGASPQPDDVRITTANGSVIAGLVASVAYESGQPSGWLSTSFDRDSTEARLWLRGVATSLPVGEYLAKVSVTAPGAGATAPMITVILKVRAADLRALVLRDRSTYIGDLSPGMGTVTGPGLDCRNGTGDCVEYVPAGTSVTLTATPDKGHGLFRWTDACEGTPTNASCTVTVSDSTTVGTWFYVKSFTIRLTVRGANATGSVLTFSSPYGPIPCNLIDGAEVVCGPPGPIDGYRGSQLEATAAFGSRFVGWSGDCGGTSRTCSLGRNPGGSYDVGASFERDPAVGNVVKVNLSATGFTVPIRARVTGGGIDCSLDGSAISGTCEAESPIGTDLTLVATADVAARYNWFSGVSFLPIGSDCPSTSSPNVCGLRMNGPREVNLALLPVR